MESLTQPVAKQSAQDDNNHRAKDWLNALTTGRCDQDEFFIAIAALLKHSPDAGWELLGLIDQYYRRGRLSAQTFGIVKAHLQSLLVGPSFGDEFEPTPARVTAPTERPSPAEHSAAPTAAAPAAEAAPIRPRDTMRIVDPDSVKVRNATLPPEDRAADPGDDSTPRLLAVGDVLRGRYLVRGLLGRGGMGTVYAATDQFRLEGSTGDQKVALKVLHTEVIKRPHLFAELRREFQYLQALSHPNIVRVHEFDRDGDLAFFTMEQLSGALLSNALSVHLGSCLHRPYALAIVRDVGSAVAHAHTRGVVHGDLNPGNIFITDEGEIRVLDFGASHQLHRGPWISEFDGQPQIAVATPAYASCQVLESETADARDDVYALACITYQLLTGKLPFGDKNALKARAMRLRPRRPPRLSKRQWQALLAGLRFDRNRRPSDMRAWLTQLDLRTAAPHLPQLPGLWTDRRRSVGARHPWRSPALAALAAVAIYWTVTHRDSVSAAGMAASAEFRSLILELQSKLPREQPQVVRPATRNEPDEAPSPPRAPATAPAAAPAALRPSNPATPSTTRPAAAAAAESPHSRVELTSDEVAVQPGESVADIVIRRKGNLRGDVSFHWWTESGTAKPGRDFFPVKTQVEHIDNGQSTVSLMIPVVQSPVSGPSRSFYVVIDDPSDNATLGPRTLTMITIPGTAPDVAP
jgi:serine/threonine protein kinase